MNVVTVAVSSWKAVRTGMIIIIIIIIIIQEGDISSS